MRPLPLVSAGVLLVAIDLRFDRFDLLLDPVGWLLVAEGARRLRLRAPAWAAAAAAVLSVTDVWLPHHLQRIDALTGKVLPRGQEATGSVSEHLVFDRVTGLQLVGMVLAVVVGTGALWLLLGALARRADRPVATRLELLRWLVVGAWALPFVVVAAVDHDGFDPVWNDGRELLALAGIVALLLVAAQLVAAAGQRWAVPSPAPLRPLA